jgi:hypothetical protein
VRRTLAALLVAGALSAGCPGGEAPATPGAPVTTGGAHLAKIEAFPIPEATTTEQLVANPTTIAATLVTSAISDETTTTNNALYFSLFHAGGGSGYLFRVVRVNPRGPSPTWQKIADVAAFNRWLPANRSFEKDDEFNIAWTSTKMLKPDSQDGSFGTFVMNTGTPGELSWQNDLAITQVIPRGQGGNEYGGDWAVGIDTDFPPTTSCDSCGWVYKYRHDQGGEPKASARFERHPDGHMDVRRAITDTQNQLYVASSEKRPAGIVPVLNRLSSAEATRKTWELKAEAKELRFENGSVWFRENDWVLRVKGEDLEYAFIVNASGLRTFCSDGTRAFTADGMYHDLQKHRSVSYLQYAADLTPLEMAQLQQLKAQLAAGGTLYCLNDSLAQASVYIVTANQLIRITPNWTVLSNI